MKSALLVASQPTKQQLLDYANAVTVVNSYAYAITNQSLPVLQFPPSNYSSFSDQFATAKTHALNWTDNVFPTMLQLPVTIKDEAANFFSMEQLMIIANLNTLIADPTNAAAKTGLASSLSTLQQLIGTQITTIGSIQNNLTSFTSQIQADAQTLSTIAAEALQAAGADQQTIQSLQSSIDQMNQQIAADQKMLTMAEVGIGVSLFVGLIGIVCCAIPGAQGIGVGLILIAVAGAATSIAFTVIESKNITDLQQSIDGAQTEITGYGQDIILLNGVNTSFTNLFNANVQAQSALTTIINMWQNLSQLIGEVGTELTTTNTDTTSAQYQQALTDFQAAETNWTDVVQFATALAGIVYNWQNAQGNWTSYSSQPPQSNSGQVNMVPSNIKAA